MRQSIVYTLPNGIWKVELRDWHNHPMDTGVRHSLFNRCLTSLVNVLGERMSMV